MLTSLQRVGAASDTATIGQPLLLQIRAVNGLGRPLSGVEVRWESPVTGDIIHPTVDTTDANGISSVQLWVNANISTRPLTARAGEAQVNFSIHSQPAAARLKIVLPSLNIVARDTIPLRLEITDTSGQPLNLPIRWATSDGKVATVNAFGELIAHAIGSATVYANTLIPPFLVDSVRVNIGAPTPARIDVRPGVEQLIAGRTLEFRAVALDSLGRRIDPREMRWSFTTPQTTGQLLGFDGDTARVAVNSAAEGVGEMRFSIYGYTETKRVSVIPDPVVADENIQSSEHCFSGPTFGPSGQWYLGTRGPGSSDSTVVVRPGRAGISTWTASAPFVGCDPSSVRPGYNTISVDAAENIYVPTRHGVLSIDGTTGVTRWHALIGTARTNVAISRRGLVFALRETEVVALDAADGAVRWRYPLLHIETRLTTPIVDDERNTLYIPGLDYVLAIDAATGVLRWQSQNIPRFSLGAIAIARNGNLYVGNEDGIRMLNTNGVEVAAYPTGSLIGAPLIDAQGNVIVAAQNGLVYGFNSLLQPIWEVDTHVPSGFTTPPNFPVLDAAGTVYIGRADRLNAINGGRWLWSISLRLAWTAYPWILGPDNFLYAWKGSGVFRVRTAGVDPAAQWPMTHRTSTRAAQRD